MVDETVDGRVRIKASRLGEMLDDPDVIPFAIEDKKGAFDDKDPYNTGGGRESGMKLSTGTFMERPKLPQPRGGEVRWHNVFFHDLDTGEDWALLDSRAVVSHYQTFWKREGDGWEQTTDLIVFAVTLLVL